MYTFRDQLRYENSMYKGMNSVVFHSDNDKGLGRERPASCVNIGQQCQPQKRLGVLCC